MRVSAALGIAAPVDRPIAGPDRLATEPSEILALVRGGRHRDVIAACTRAHGAVLGQLCMALLGSQADADRATRKTLLRAHRGMATYRGEASVKAWRLGIARHVCVHMLAPRRRGRDAGERAAILDEPAVSVRLEERFEDLDGTPVQLCNGPDRRIIPDRPPARVP